MGFDLDGVLCPDIDLDWDKPGFDFSYLFDLRMKLPPMFVPQGRYTIITGRPFDDKKHTEEWMKKFNLHPVDIRFNPKDPVDWRVVAQHKVDTIMELRYSLTLFVESSHKQVEYIRQQVHHIPIYHFSDFVAGKIYEGQSQLRHV